MKDPLINHRSIPREPLEGSLGEDELRRHLRVFLLVLAATCAVFAAVEGVVAILYGERIVALTAISLCGGGLWLIRARRRVETEALAPLVGRIVTVIFALIIANGIAQPTGQEVVALAAILPVVAAMPFLDRAGLVRAMVMAWFVAVGAMAYGAFGPTTTRLPDEANGVLQVVSVGLICSLLFLLLWQFANRLKDTLADLRTLTHMSSELNQTLDPRWVGDVTARHMARALSVDAAGICYWDQDGDRLLTYGYYPLEGRADVAEAYDLADYPLSRRLLRDQKPVVISVEDPDADPAEVAYLRSVGQAAMMMVPLVARGRALGIVELTTSRPHAFTPACANLARMLADEASMALDNARLHEEIRHQAYHDALTDLPNQVQFRERLAEAVAVPGNEDSVAVLFIDLDDFKEVNDGFGHTMGDTLLRGVAERIGSVVRPNDLAARFGGDEFAVLLRGVAGVTDAEHVAQRIVEALAQPFVLTGRNVRIAASVGVATSEVSGPDSDALLRDADFAMYRAKGAGKNGFATFSPGMREAA